MDPAGLDIPTKTSDLENDSGYITNADIPQAATYIHSQIAPAAIWMINHELGKHPSVAIVDSAGDGGCGGGRVY